MLHYKLLGECDIHVVKMYLLRKHLKSIIWQQYLLSRGANKQLHHYRVTPTEPEVSRERHTINSDGSYLCQMLFVSDTELGEFVPLSYQVNSVIYCTTAARFKNWTVIPFCRENNAFCMIKHKQNVKNKGSKAFYSVITKAKLSTQWCFLSSLLAWCLMQHNIQSPEN